MPPAVSRMHHSQMSNPFAHINPQPSIPQGSHYPSQSQHLPNNFNAQHAFGSSGLNGGISPFNPSAAYGGSAFSTMPTTAGSTFPSGMLSGQGQGLASVAAQQGFARGAAMQEHGHQQADVGLGGVKSGVLGRIRDVWRHNLDQEMAVLRQLILKYPYVSMDAEFPGIVARPIGNFAGSKAEYHYQTLRCNVDILKPIQVGITVWTPDGELPPPQPDQELLNQWKGRAPYPNNLMFLPCTWVFNFHFDLEQDMYAESSIELLKQSGVDFQRHLEMGIAFEQFGALLTTSGLVLCEDVHWLSFHSGYDFGYLVKLLSDDALPDEQPEFFKKVGHFFPRLWDIKFILRHAQKERSSNRLQPEGIRIIDSLGPKSGLQDLADELGCQRVGAAHSGGSDAWLTGSVFWAMRSKIFGGYIDESLMNSIYGLHGVLPPASQQYREEFFAAQGTPGQQHAGSSSQQQGGMTNGSTLGGGAPGFTPNNPSTPTSSHAGLNSTPGPGGHGFPHGLGGGFGNFQFAK